MPLFDHQFSESPGTPLLDLYWCPSIAVVGTDGNVRRLDTSEPGLVVGFEMDLELKVMDYDNIVGWEDRHSDKMLATFSIVTDGDKWGLCPDGWVNSALGSPPIIPLLCLPTKYWPTIGDRDELLRLVREFAQRVA